MPGTKPDVCENNFPSFKTQISCNLTFVKTTFQVLKLKFLACSMKQAFYLLRKLTIARDWQQENTFLQAFHSVPGCQTCMCKRGISVRVRCLIAELFAIL